MPPYQPSADWQYEIPTAGSKRLPPAARYVESLTHQGYGFEAAVADLVDNSIDAGAHNAVISFLRDDQRLVGLLVVDDGSGMNDETLDTAMTVGEARSTGTAHSVTSVPASRPHRSRTPTPSP